MVDIYGDFLFKLYLNKLSDKVIFLSATLGSKSAFCKELGINENECLYISTNSPFDPQNSPVMVMPKIKLSKEVYSENIKKVGGIIDDVIGWGK